MKKLLWLILAAFAQSAAFSISAESGIIPSMQTIATELKRKNTEIQRKVATKIVPLMKQIEKTTKENAEILRKIRALEQHKALLEKEYLFYQKQETELLRLQAASNRQRSSHD